MFSMFEETTSGTQYIRFMLIEAYDDTDSVISFFKEKFVKFSCTSV